MAPTKSMKNTNTKIYRRKKTPYRGRRVPRASKLFTNVNVGRGFPSRMCATLKYADTITLTSPSGGLYNYQYILNGLFDTDHTSIGHQPMYFDTYMAIYNHYTVIGCKMTITCVAYESNTSPIVIVLWENDDTVITPSSIDNFAEQSKGKQILISEQSGPKTLTLKWNPKKIHGPVMANTLLRGNISTNPTETSTGVISIQSADQVSTTDVSVQVRLEYITVFSELRDAQGS